MPKGIHTSKRGRKKTFDESRIEWVSLYNSGRSIQNIARDYCASKGTVSDYLKSHGVTIRKNVINDESVFLKSFVVGEKDSCWNWQGSANNKGYGIFNLNGVLWFAHRFSYKYYSGEIGGLFVCHSCDNPKCVNPNHLFLGTQADNMQDRVNKGRFKRKFDEAQIVGIRLLRSKGVPTNSIAMSFCVSKSAIQRIVSKKTYLDVV